jgi:PadR family transcriptional regulator AphA
MSLKHAILVLLETEPGSGYDLMRHFKSRLGYFWNAKHQQIYQQLKLLNEEGLISCELASQPGKPDKKIYSITAAGEVALGEWLASEVKPSKVNDALLVKLYGGHLTSCDNLLEEISRHQAFHEKTLCELLKIEQSYQQLPEDKQEKYRLPYITLRRGIIGEEAWLAWAEEAKKAIKK